MLESKIILKKYWGFETFRPLQEAIIQSVIDGEDTLALLPTGGGKSICFQVPGLQLDGVCLVVSPLIALMHDQIENLKSKGIKAIAITSGMSKREIDIALDNVIYGNFKFLYVSPERLNSYLFLQRFEKMNINLIAVDEAHCISQWGYDFRPPYLQISELKKIKPNVPFLALTATATPIVVKDIQEKLEFKKANVFQKSFERKNVAYITIQTNNKLNRIIEFSKKLNGSGIIYCGTRKATKTLCHHLTNIGIKADFYHGGLNQEQRKLKQEAWLNNQTKIIVATNAFGMGIDKPDVRFVLHYDIPQSIEAYFQEAGRGGRDLKKARAIMFYEPEDIKALQSKIELKYPPITEIKKIYNALGNFFQQAIGSGKDEIYPFDILEFSDKYNYNVLTVYNAIKFLELEGLILYSETAYDSSKLMFTANHYELYQYQVRNNEIDKIVKFILRSHVGIFDQMVSINEFVIAKKLNISQTTLIKHLTFLADQNVADYFPKPKGGSITYLTERLSDTHFSISKAFYDNRKKDAFEKLNAMLEFVENKTCRNIYLLNYFGEKNAQPCGQCNVCLSIDDTILENPYYHTIKKCIDEMLNQKTTVLTEDVITKLHHIPRNHILSALRWLQEHDIIYLDESTKMITKGIK